MVKNHRPSNSMGMLATHQKSGTMDEQKRQTSCRHLLIGSTAALIVVTALVLLTMTPPATMINLAQRFCSWLIVGESGSAVLRNIGLLLLAILGLPFAIWRTIVAAHQADIARHVLRNERHQKAVEMLGHPNLTVRLGGIYALQNLSKEDPTNYHIQVMRIFSAYLRYPTTGHPTEIDERNPEEIVNTDSRRTQIPRDVLDVLLSIGTRDQKEIEIEIGVGFDLVIKEIDLRGIKMYEVVSFTYEMESFRRIDSRPKKRANLSRIHFRSVNFSKSDLSFVDFSNAKFWDTDLTHSILHEANLSGTSWEGGTLCNAKLNNADLSRARILETSFTRTDLSSADLSGVVFQEVDMSNANLRGTNLSGTCFSLIKHKGALFSREGAKSFGARPDEFYVGVRGLTQSQLDQAWASPSNPPQMKGVADPDTGKQLVWHGKAVRRRR